MSITRTSTGQGYGGGDGGGEPPDQPDDGVPSAYKIRMTGLSSDFQLPSRTLLPPAAKVLKRVGGVRHAPVEVLRYDGSKLTPLGGGLVNYSALTIVCFDDKLFYQTGQLRQLGYDLARKLELMSWLEFRNLYYPDLGDAWLLTVRLTPIEEGSLHWVKRLVPYAKLLGITVGVMAQGPAAYEHAKDIYWPAIERAFAASRDYADHYFEALGDLIEITVTPVGPTIPTGPQAQRGEGGRPVRRRRKAGGMPISNIGQK